MPLSDEDGAGLLCSLRGVWSVTHSEDIKSASRFHLLNGLRELYHHAPRRPRPRRDGLLLLPHLAFLGELRRVQVRVEPAGAQKAFVYGCFYGITNVMTPIITRRAFGDAEYPVIYSRVSMAASIGSVVSGFIWGASIEATGGYVLMFVGVIVVMALTAVAVLAIGRLSRKEQR